MKLKQCVKLDNRRLLPGAIMGTVVLLMYILCYDWKSGLIFGLLFFASGFLKLPVENPWGSFFLNGAWAIVCIFVSCVIPTRMVSQESFLDIGAYRIAMNLVCAAFVYGVCLFITGKIKAAVILASGLLLILSVINGFVFQFRGNEFKPTDIYAAKTAWNVASQYSFRIPKPMADCIVSWLLLVMVTVHLPKEKYGIPGIWIRLGATAASLLVFGVLCYGARVIHPNSWSNGGTVENGYLLNFAVGIRDSVVQKPEGYSQEAVKLLEEQYQDSAKQKEALPNLVIIMSESFADFRVLGDDLRSNQSITPFLDTLSDNTVRGYALTPVFGGLTANAEFEVLTGGSMAFLPEGAVAYQQYLYNDTASLVRILEKAGYQTLATHPYLSTGWSRTTVYPHLGFSRMTFIEDYPGEELVRDFISDREMYHYVVDALEQEQEPLFLFGITMQNHGDYIYSGDNYEQTIFLEGYREDYPMAQQYLTLLQETDKATEAFIQELESFSEDTVVLFFGDHFPQIEGSFFEEVHGGTFDTLSERMLQYTVPFFIWANFDIPEQTVPITSLPYLPGYLLECAGVEKPAYYQFLKALEEQIPAISPMGYYSKSRGTYLSLEEAEDTEAQWIRDYKILQYNMLFEKDNRSSVFFPVN